MSVPTLRMAVVDGFELAIDAQDSLGLASGQPFEPEVRQALQRLVRAGDRVADIGANIGYFTLHLAHQVGAGGQVYAFEPEPKNHALLQHNLQHHGLAQVQAFQIALGAAPGVATLHVSEHNGGMHRLYDSLLCTGAAVQVPVQRLDDVIGEHTFDLLKIDIEGYEPLALLGAESILRRSPRLKIISEYCPASMLDAGSQPLHFLRWLLGLGYRPFELDGRPADLAALLADAQCYETLGRERLVATCEGAAVPEMLQRVQGLVEQLGCRRPMIENLLFARDAA